MIYRQRFNFFNTKRRVKKECVITGILFREGKKRGENKKRERERGVRSERGRNSLCSHFKGHSKASSAFQSGLI